MEEEKKRLVIIDGNALVHRAFHALPPLTTKNGQLVNAVYGFLLVFLKTLKEFKPEYIAATFDLAGPTFRHKEYKEYKAQRPKAPDELYEQIPIIKSILRSFNVSIFEKQGYEADDVIGTITRKVTTQKPEVRSIIVTGDLDALQLVDDKVNVFTLRKGIKDTLLYNVSRVKERYGVSPSQLLDFKALRGDPSDNIPGVLGVGEKTAAELIKEFNTIENLYQEIESGGAALIKQAVLEKLKKNKDKAFLSKKLVQIKQDVPIDFNLDDCLWKNYNKEKVSQTLKNFEFFSLVNKLP